MDSQLRSEGRKILLILDNCTCHPDMKNVLSNIKMLFLPSNTTSVLQPVDQGIIRNFKVHYRNRLLARMTRSLNVDSSILNIDLLDSMRLITESWNSLTETTIKNCFAHAKLIKNTFF